MPHYLVKDLQKTYNLLLQNQAIDKEYKMLHEASVPNLYYLGFFIMSLITYGLIMFEVINVLDSLQEYIPKKGNAFLILLLLGFYFGIFIVVILFFMSYIPNKIRKGLVQKKLALNKEKIETLVEVYRKNKNYLDNNSIVPNAYQYFYALEWLIRLIENKRADTLKEAINLFESDQQHIEKMNELRAIEAEIRRTRIRSNTIIFLP